MQDEDLTEQDMLKNLLNELESHPTPNYPVNLAEIIKTNLSERVKNEVNSYIQEYKKNIDANILTPKSEIQANVFSNPETVQVEIDKTIAMLLKECLIKKVKNEYRITTLLSKIQATLKIKKMDNLITYPEIEEIDNFIITYLKSKKGNSLQDALRVEKNRTITNLRVALS
ncbi:hypothetical protein LQZ21_02535 [Treponema sp. TIM-1]|uniref:hypothetical protein n=1 Tax=Treponema sp. TIM-1 TaxID=2898417 RepID=UPI0039807F5F